MHACMYILYVFMCACVCVPAAERLYSGVQSLGITPGQLRAEAWMSGLAVAAVNSVLGYGSCCFGFVQD